MMCFHLWSVNFILATQYFILYNRYFGYHNNINLFEAHAFISDKIEIHHVHHPTARQCRNVNCVGAIALSSSDNDIREHPEEEGSSNNHNPFQRIFFDISIADESIGRLVFRIQDPSPLPLHAENIMKLCSEERKSIDPSCSYIGCQFRYSPQFIENFPQYRWSHVLDGRGRNAIGKATEKITDPENMRLCTHSIFGGSYYGLNYQDIPLIDGEEEGVVLTVPLTGANRGMSSFSIVRVGSSPMEWKERLLINSAVLGSLEKGTEVLHYLARQKIAPPQISNSGIL